MVEIVQQGSPPEIRECSKTVLVVEDDEDIRYTLEQVLEAEGHRVASAGNGKEALDRLRGDGERPCLILLDLMMPVMDGLEFLSILRRDEVLRDLPVVVVSAWPKVAEKVGLETQGFVRKPVDLDTLLALVEKYC